MDTKTAVHPIYHKQFAKFHEKIQKKYNEMQRKLEKSRSIDALMTLNDDHEYSEKKYISVSDLTNVVNHLYTNEIGRKRNLHSVAYLDKPTFQEIISKEAVVNEAESSLSINDKFDSENEDDSLADSNQNFNFFGSNDFKTSLESLNETKESDGSSEPYTPTTKSIRSKIKSRLKKRQNEKDKKEKEQKEKLKRKETQDKVDKYILSNTTKYSVVKSNKKVKLATVTIALIEVTGLEEIVDEKTRVLLFRFRLGVEKRKSKIVKSDSALVKFQELLNFNLFEDDNIFEITLWDREVLIGRNVLDLLTLEKEKTHKMQISLEGGEFKNLQTLMLLTISGTSSLNILYNDDESKRKKREYLLHKKYLWYRLCDDFSNVGFLRIIVYGAKGLSGNECFCTVKLNYQRVQTQTDYKTNDPSWMKIFSL